MRLKEVAPQKTWYAQDLATEKGSMWLTSLLLKEMRFNQKKRELRDGLSLCYDWPIAKIPSTCLCGEPFTKGHTMICMRGGFVIQRQQAPGPGRRAPEHGLLRCSYWTSTPRCWRRAVDARVKQSAGCKLDIHARGFWKLQRLAFFDVRVCYLNAESYRDLKLQQIIILSTWEWEKVSILK